MTGTMAVWLSSARARWTAHEASCLACGIFRKVNGLCPDGREILADLFLAERRASTGGQE